MTRIVILTGAGISAESGLGTFRDEGGLWAQHRIEDVATPEGYARDPQLVTDFYNARRAQASEATANAAHHALARLETEHNADICVVTQNVDALHEQAGSRNVIHMHGELAKGLCARCDHRWPVAGDMIPHGPCPSCGADAARPDIVWFGEMPYQMDRIEQLLSQADLFVSIGTSGNVYPAAGFVQAARAYGAATLELNLEPSEGATLFDETRNGPASVLVPDWVDQVLSAAP